MPDLFKDLYDNYVCYTRACDYKTTAGNAEKSLLQVNKDGGYVKEEHVTMCPRCKQNSLFFVDV